jgi:hypothetical protein
MRVCQNNPQGHKSFILPIGATETPLACSEGYLRTLIGLAIRERMAEESHWPVRLDRDSSPLTHMHYDVTATKGMRQPEGKITSKIRNWFFIELEV